jgi:hypothetical protein
MFSKSDRMQRNLLNDHTVNKLLDVPLLDKEHKALLPHLKYKKTDRMKISFLVIIPDFSMILGRATIGAMTFGISISLKKKKQ